MKYNYPPESISNPSKFHVAKKMQYHKSQWYNVIVTTEIAQWLFSSYCVNRDFIGPPPVLHSHTQYKIPESILLMMELKWG